MADEAKMKINGTEYDLPTDVTLGEQREVKRLFGFRWADLFEQLSAGDPDAWAGFIYVAVRRTRPTDPEAVIMAEIDSLDDNDLGAAIEALNATNDDEEGAESDRPTEGGGDVPVPGNQGTTPASDGPQTSDTSSTSDQTISQSSESGS